MPAHYSQPPLALFTVNSSSSKPSPCYSKARHNLGVEMLKPAPNEHALLPQQAEADCLPGVMLAAFYALRWQLLGKLKQPQEKPPAGLMLCRYPRGQKHHLCWPLQVLHTNHADYGIHGIYSSLPLLEVLRHCANLTLYWQSHSCHMGYIAVINGGI